MGEIYFRELIELFLNRIIHDIKSENEVPNINFNFKKEDISLFEDIIDNPFERKGFWLPNATKEDLDLLLSQDEDVITINVDNADYFFEQLQAIINSSVELDDCYGWSSFARIAAMRIMKYIWLRMGIEDLNNIDRFLEKQLEFYNNRLLDSSTKKVGTFYNYDVLMKTKSNHTWDESTRSMIFTIKDPSNDNEYDLPRILYDIDNENNCYIYGIQSNINGSKDKTIGRKLYKINKNIDNPNIHPSKVHSLLLFINELKKNDISKIIVPSMQLLNYDYHKILGMKAKQEKERIENFLKDHPDDFDYLLKYNNIKDWYNRIYDKQDLISHLKTEELFNLMYRITLHDPSIEITNEVNIEGDSLNAKILKKKV